jgi:monofunctional biosynthetic peptidoglycan transglycosylase
MRRWVAAAAAVTLLAAGAAALLASGPDVSPLAGQPPGATAYMRLRAAESGARALPRVRWLPLDSVSPLLACAVVKAEDDAFFRHGGIDWGRTRHAAGAWLAGQGGGGASTLSQQLARNLYLSPQPTLKRKLREAVIARRLDSALGKRRVLELYLNVAEWGDGVWGVDAASRRWLGKPAAAAEPFEAAFLASLLAAPRRPLERANLARAHRTQRRVVNQLYGAGLLDGEEWRTAITRGYALREGLKRGWPLETALRVARDTPPVPVRLPPRPLSRPLPADRAIQEECGYAQETENQRLIAESRP